MSTSLEAFLLSSTADVSPDVALPFFYARRSLDGVHKKISGAKKINVGGSRHSLDTAPLLDTATTTEFYGQSDDDTMTFGAGSRRVASGQRK